MADCERQCTRHNLFIREDVKSVSFTEAVNELTGVDVLGLVVMLVYDVVVVVVGRSPPDLPL